MPEPGDVADKRMKLRYAGACRLCGTELAARTEAIYERVSKTVRCLDCTSATEDEAAVTETEPVAEASVEETEAVEEAVAAEKAGVAGASARREYERRKARDEERLRQKWGRLGGLAVALSEEKQSTRAWDTGAVGEERLGARLDGLASDSVAVLHDRRIPGTKANIDHMVITATGVWVVDAKKYKARPTLKVEGGIFRPRVEKLLVGRRDCTKLVDGVLKQVGLVRDVVGDVPVTGALCFVEADFPLIGGAFATRAVHVLWPKRLAKVINQSSEDEIVVDVAAVHQLLADHFPPA
ncbi:nuclease-related domain-containing protein [Nocardioides limicola]|uniref:nuclease-related domain-containing protein n=1 Tax=Nocardioides limicola TaxID=2803368 RepID=UPI00193B7589|nr:nuclease-related domain-containing protein [Nocardioides sp. DJM-14]